MQVIGYLILYGDKRDHDCLVRDRARAEQVAVNCHGLLVRMIVHPDDAGLLESKTPAG